ncbi:MAG: DUF4004 family protein [Bacillota bacterium]|nr:DUF4004 family protein [Bacillota bacterium]
MDLISKKELLTVTGISYGQLYRWKRERLIPEEWFIKQSSFTGQETFFPKEQILKRVSSIIELKDTCSLEELAKILTFETSATISGDKLKNICELDENFIKLLSGIDKKVNYRAMDIAFLTMVKEVAIKANLSSEQLNSLIECGFAFVREQKTPDVVSTIFLTGDEVHVVLSKDTSIEFDKSIKVLGSLVLGEAAGNLSLKYKQLFNC